MPLISVIIPVYNTENYLKKCVDSVLAQTYKDFELFLVDDGSKDSSPAICDEYAKSDARITVIHKINEGPGIARNAALDVARGEYILFVDSDDWILPEMLEKMVAAAEKYNADLSVCGYSFFNGFKIKSPYSYEGLKIFDKQSLMKSYVSTPDITPAPVYKLYKRFLFDRIRFPVMKVGEDQYIMHEILALCNIGLHVGECFYVVNLRRDSLTRSKFNLNMLGIMESSMMLQKFIKDQFPELYEHVELRCANDIIFIMSEIIETFSYNKYKDEYKQLKNQLIEERNRIKKIKDDIDSEKMKNINQACDHGTIFYLRNLYSGIKRRCRNLIVKILGN